MAEIKYYTVSAYNEAVKRLLDRSPECQDVHIKGEISNLTKHSSGHWYFSLKDEQAQIRATMWKFDVMKLANPADFKDGVSVEADGKITLYPVRGEMQVTLSNMRIEGEGDLAQKFEELKKKLEGEGLFDEDHKKPIPRFPQRIGIVTAPTGAAIHDIISTIKRRYPIAETILFPSLVQGDGAKESIVKQIAVAQNYDIDVLIVGRGGGSIEDLWAFNEEIVARAIYGSDVPVISAVGHEPDVTIADYVSDRRAPTPTGAAEMAVPNMTDLFNDLNQKAIRSTKCIQNMLDGFKERLRSYMESYTLSNPLGPFESRIQKLDDLTTRATSVIKNKLNISKMELRNILSKKIIQKPEEIFKDKKNTFEVLLNKLKVLNPMSTLARGYSITETEDGKVIDSVNSVKKDDKIKIKVTDGTFDAKVL